MIVKLNGMFWYDMNEKKYLNEFEGNDIIVPQLRKTINPKMKTMAIALWTLSATFVSKSASATGTMSFFENMQPLNWVFQDLALGLGSLAILIGFILFAVKKRWGTKMLQITGLVIIGVFLAPSLLLLIGIIGYQANDALLEAFKSMRQAKEVMGQ